MSQDYISPVLVPIADALEALIIEAASAVQKARRERARRARKPSDGSGCSLRPSVETPLWNELRARVVSHTTKRGAKAILARQMGLPRQRIHKFLKERSAMPDGERTLWLLAWVSAKERGIEFAM